jgi:hypothetical protein
VNKRLLRLTLILFFFLVLHPLKVLSQIELNGFVRNFNAITTTDGNNYLIGRNRVELNLQRNLNRGKIYISSQILNPYSDSLEALDFRIREAYFEMYLGKYDIRIGQQLIPMGETNGFFLTDILNPFDLSEFLTQELRDIRQGIPAIKITRYSGSNFLELGATPLFVSNRFAQPSSAFFPFDNLSNLSGLPTDFGRSLEQQTRTDAQVSLRYAWNANLKFDLDLFAMYWHNNNTAFRKSLDINNLRIPPAVFELEAAFLQTAVFGYAGNYVASDNLILKSEAAFFSERYVDYLNPRLVELLSGPQSPAANVEIADIFANNTDGFLLKRPFLNQMIGAQLNLGGWIFEGQFVSEYILDYRDEILPDQWYKAATLLVQKQFLRDKLDFRLFSRYNLNGNDFWANPELAYDITDGVVFISGFQFFGGEQPDSFYGHFSFRDYADVSFGYLKLTAYF